MKAPEILGPALRMAAERSGCSLVFTEAVLSEPIPRIFVVFTDPTSTLSALKSAAAWADQLNFGIDVIVPHVVPYPLPVSEPSVAMDVTRAEIRRIVDESGINADVHVYLCRDAFHTLTEVLPPHSTILIGRRITWFSSGATRLARKLRKRGHLVILA